MHMTKRISALLIAIAMMLMGLTALAEPAAIPMPLSQESVFERGGAIKTDMDVTLDAQTVMGLASMMGGALDENTTMIVTNVLGAINKLKTTIVQNKTGFSAVIGTDAGAVIDAQGVANLEAGEVSFTTNMLPGLKLELPKEMLQGVLESQAQMTAMAAGANAEMLKPYGDALNEAFQVTIAKDALPQVGTFEVAGVGTFKQMAEFDITQETIAAVLDAVNGVFKQDTQMQQMVDEYLKMAQAQTAQIEAAASEAAAATEEAAGTEVAPGITMTSTTTIKNSAELIAMLDEGVAEMCKNPSRVVAHQKLYVEGDALFYTELEPNTDDGTAPMMVSVLGNHQEGGINWSIGIVVDAETPSYAMGDPAATATPEPTPAPAVRDWHAIKAAILDGTKPMGTLGQIDLVFGTDAAAKQSVGKMNMSVLASGIKIGIVGETKSNMEAPYAAEGNFSLSAFTDAPLLSVVIKSEETTEAPAALAEATTTMLLAETMSEEDQQTLSNAAKGALPSLLEKLKTALPEEGAALAAMIEQAMQPATTTPN